MKGKVILLLAIFSLAMPGLSLACPACSACQADAECAITEAETMLEELNSMGSWYGPALVMKMEAEKYLEMAKESCNAGEYTDAVSYAKKALEHAKKALGLRAWLLLTRSRLSGAGAITYD